MKKIFFALTCIAILALTACENQNQPVPPADTLDFTVPKKHLIEEFTSQSCGYCPYGMDALQTFIGNDSNWVLVLHHAGYANDHFTISGSTAIASTLGVKGAPTITVNRANTRIPEGSKLVFHPGYLQQADRSQFDSTTYATVDILNSYDASSRELKVKVSGKIGKSDYGNLKLTVLVKESGMIDTQLDYNSTFQGWQEFRHTNAARAFLTAPKGDDIDVIEDKTRHYELELSTTLDDAWKAENCMVVAFLSEDIKPVVQAAQKPVVPGTKGGADTRHGGITKVPVPDYYPEPGPTQGPATYSGNRFEEVPQAYAQYKAYKEYGFNYWSIQAYNTSSFVTVNNNQCVPFAIIYLFTELDQTTIPAGTYPVNTSLKPGTVYAGFRDDENFIVDGSTFGFASVSYLNQGYYMPEAEWLIADGEMTIEADSWHLAGHALNGAAVNLKGTTIQIPGSASAPVRKQNAGNKLLPSFLPRVVEQ